MEDAFVPRQRAGRQTRAENSMTSRISCSILLLAAALAGEPLACHPAAGQPFRGPMGGGMGGSRTMPTPSYHAAFADFYDGDYRTALERFRNEAVGARKVGTTRWIDSICYETMIGECYYQIGANADALDHYTAALNLFLANSTWFSSVVPDQIRAEQPAAAPALAGPQPPGAAGALEHVNDDPNREYAACRGKPEHPKRRCAAAAVAFD